MIVRERPADGQAEGALVLFHGRGADEHDLFPLLDALDPEQRLVGATPRGPLSLPPGGAHWYILGGIGTPERTTFHARPSRSSPRITIPDRSSSHRPTPWRALVGKA